MREHGVTRIDRVLPMMDYIEKQTSDTFTRLRDPKRLTPKERDALSRALAGAIGYCEGIRMWLSAGAQR